jgi:hypothetical protein
MSFKNVHPFRHWRPRVPHSINLLNSTTLTKQMRQFVAHEFNPVLANPTI